MYVVTSGLSSTMRIVGTGYSPLGSRLWVMAKSWMIWSRFTDRREVLLSGILDTRFWMLDVGQIKDDLVPISFPEEKAFIGDTR